VNGMRVWSTLQPRTGWNAAIFLPRRIAGEAMPLRYLNKYIIIILLHVQNPPVKPSVLPSLTVMTQRHGCLNS
jgi:hypothetical protein